MNQTFKQKAVVAGIAAALALGSVASVSANQFADTTNVVSVSAGVTVPVAAAATLANQLLSFTETVQGAVFANAGTLVLTLDTGKWASIGGVSLTTSDQVVTGAFNFLGGLTLTVNGKISTDGKKLTLTTSSPTGTQTAAASLQLKNIVLDTTGVAAGTAINVAIDSSSTITGLTSGSIGKVATTSAAAVTITNPTAVKVAAGASTGTLPGFSFVENIPTSVGTTAGAIKLSLKGGYTWSARPTITGSTGLTANNSTGTAVSTQSGSDATYSVTAQTSGSNKGTITFGGTPAVFVPAGSTGDIVATLTVLDESQNVIASQDVTFASIVTKGITSAATQVSGKTGFDTVFTGRIYDAASDFTTKNVLKVNEALADSVVTGSAVTLTYNTGKWVDDAATPVALTNNFNPTAATGKEGFTLGSCAAVTGNAAALSCAVSAGANDAVASEISYAFRGINTIGATAGDLTVAVASNSSTTAAAVKVAELKNATSASASGTVPTVIPGNAAIALPDVVLTETTAAALDTGYFALRLPTGVTFDTTVVPTVTVTKADGTAVTGKLAAVSTGSFLDSGAELQLQVSAQSTTTEGPLTVKVSGLKAKATSSASVGDVTLSVFGVATGATTSADNDRSAAKKDAGAKPTKASVKVGTVASNDNPTYPAVNVADSTKAVISGLPVTAAGKDQGKPGAVYVAFIYGGTVFFMDSTGAWTTYTGKSPASYFTGNLTTVSVDVLKVPTDLSSLKDGQLILGYGLGLAGLSDPFNEMLNNTRYNVLYTVK